MLWNFKCVGLERLKQVAVRPRTWPRLRTMDIPTIPAAFVNTCPSQVAGLPALLFTHLIQTLITANCRLGSSTDYPSCYGSKLRDQEEFDFIVVGAGSAGSAVASRLAENSAWKVLLVEAGGDPTYYSDVPAFLFSIQGSDIDWGYRGYPSKNACLGMNNKQCAFPRGKVLGGCSSINALLNVRGNPADYDEWAKLGNPGWTFKEVLPYFKKLENFGQDDEYHSSEGPMHINPYIYDENFELLKTLIVGGFNELGYPKNDDITGESQIGFGKARATLKNGLRINTARGYLTPTKDTKTNLKVLKNTPVERIIFDGKKAAGVVLNRNNRYYTASAKKEIIISAGSIGSPQLLQLSGVGNKKYLKELGIDVVNDLPGVGKNFQDHLVFPGLAFAVNKETAQPIPIETQLNALYQYLTNGTGLYATIGITDLMGFIDTESTASTVPNLQFHSLFFPKQDTYLIKEFTRAANFKQEIIDNFVELTTKSDVLVLLPTLLKPKSRGEVRIKSKNLEDSPIIDPQFFREKEDFEVIVKGAEILKELSKTKHMSYLKPEVTYLNIPACNQFEKGGEDFLVCHIKHLASSIYHPVGTCKMGPKSDKKAVVDSRLRVHGINNLRVIDASIMPTIIRGNTNTPTIMIAEKAADMIKEDWLPKHNEL